METARLGGTKAAGVVSRRRALALRPGSAIHASGDDKSPDKTQCVGPLGMLVITWATLLSIGLSTWKSDHGLRAPHSRKALRDGPGSLSLFVQLQPRHAMLPDTGPPSTKQQNTLAAADGARVGMMWPRPVMLLSLPCATLQPRPGNDNGTERMPSAPRLECPALRQTQCVGPRSA